MRQRNGMQQHGVMIVFLQTPYLNDATVEAIWDRSSKQSHTVSCCPRLRLGTKITVDKC